MVYAATAGGGGAPIPGVPGVAMPPPVTRYSTNFLNTTASQLGSVRQQTGLALQGGSGTAYVWLGSHEPDRPTEELFHGAPGRSVSYQRPEQTMHNLKSVDELMSEFESKSYKEKRNMAKLLAMAGFLDVAYADSLEETVNQATLMDVTNAYASLLGASAARFAQGQNMSPEDLLEMNIRYNMHRAGFDIDNKKFDLNQWWDKATGKDASGKPKTVTQTTKSVDIWNADDARGLARRTLQDALGRDPTEAEYEDFVAALQAEQRANPTVTHTTTHYNAEGDVTNVNTQTSGGMGESAITDFAQQQAESAPDWAEWQAVGTYFPALMQMVGAAVPNA